MVFEDAFHNELYDDPLRRKLKPRYTALTIWSKFNDGLDKIKALVDKSMAKKPAQGEQSAKESSLPSPLNREFQHALTFLNSIVHDITQGKQIDEDRVTFLESKLGTFSQALRYKGHFKEILDTFTQTYLIGRYAPNKKIESLCLKFIQDNLTTIELYLVSHLHLIGENTPVDILTGYKTVSLLIECAQTEEQRRLGVELFDRHRNFIIQHLTHKSIGIYLMPYVVAKLSEPLDSEFDPKSFITRLMTDSHLSLSTRERLLKKINQVDPKLLGLFSETILLSYGLPDHIAKDIVSSWRTSSTTVSYPVEIVMRNLDNIQRLEKASPGATTLLYSHFGITHFGRYPYELLLSQIQDFDNVSRPYGIILSAYNDHNGAMYANYENYQVLYEELKSLGLGIRVVEARNRFGVARRLFSLNKLYGQGQKIAFMIINAHGRKDRIFFGPEEGDWIDIRDFEGTGTNKVKDFYEEKMPIVLISCSTGKEGGMAQRFAKSLKTVATGPSSPASIKSIHARRDDAGKLVFDVVYVAEGKKIMAGSYSYDKL